MSGQYSFPSDTYILIGKVIRAHGLRGDLKVIPTSGQLEMFIIHSRFALIADDGRMTKLLDSEKVRVQGKQIILKLDTIDTRDEAELTIGMGVLLSRTDLVDPEIDMGTSPLFEGRMVRLENHEIIGVVASSFSNGAHDIIVVRNNGDEFLIPLVDEMIVFMSEQEIVINPPPGLLEINADVNR